MAATERAWDVDPSSGLSTWSTISIFVGGTFDDMRAERDLLQARVYPRLREALLRHRVHVSLVDLPAPRYSRWYARRGRRSSFDTRSIFWR
jgi:hypothetical protein